MVIIKVLALASAGPSINDDTYLKEFDFEARNGLGTIITTDSIQEAKSFSGIAEAAEFWKTISTTRPIRPDGKPNRPFTAYTILMVPIKYADDEEITQ